MRHDDATRRYVQRRTREGKNREEIMRCVKRYIAREVFHATTPPGDIPTGAKLRSLRTARRLSLTDVCTTVGISPNSLSRLERGITHDTALARRIQDSLSATDPTPSSDG